MKAVLGFLKKKYVYIPLLVVFTGYVVFVFKMSQKPTISFSGGTVHITSQAEIDAQRQAAEARMKEIDKVIKLE